MFTPRSPLPMEDDRDTMSAFEPVRTLADLQTLDERDIIDGYMSAQRGGPEPGPNRGRAYWHGWRNRMIDIGALKGDEACWNLAHEYVESLRSKGHPR